MDPSVLDLTFLTETERKWITEVLNRDEALQKKEDERIARLKSKAARTNNATIKKKIKLRSGEWFFDLVQPNKKSFKSGRETVRASIRNKAKSTQHRRPPQPPPDVLPQADIIMEEPEQHQPVVASEETQISQSEPPTEEPKISPYQLTYVEDDTANRIGSYQEDVESYDSDYNKGSTFASMHEAFVQEIPQSHVSHESETHGEVEASIENSDKQQKQAPVIPENYEYLQLTPDEPEVESEEGKPEPVLKRTGSIRRKSTKREKPQDQAPKIVLTSYDSSSTEAQSEFDEKPAESGPFALIEKDTTDESSQAASIISSTTVTGSSEKFDEYVDDILEQPAEYDTPVTTTDYSVSESDVSVEVVDVVTPSIASDDGLKTIEEEPKSEPQEKVDGISDAVDFLQSLDDVRGPKTGYDKKKRSKTNLLKGTAQSMPALSKIKTPSLTGSTWSVYSAAAHEQTGIEITGTVELGFTYSYKTGALNIHVGSCKNLAAVDGKRMSNPYVKTYLLPDKHSKKKTKTKKHTVNPEYNEVLKYTVSETELSTRTLNVAVWHDKIGANKFLGEVNLNCDQFEFQIPVKMREYELAPKDIEALIGNSSTYTGDVEIALRYVPSMEDSLHGTGDCRLELVLKNVNNIPTKGGAAAPIYVKGYFLPDKSQETKQKTPVMSGSTRVVFDHLFVFTGVHKNELYNRCVELTVYQREKIGQRLVGGVRLGTGTGSSFEKSAPWMDSINEEVNLWQRMIQSPETWVNGTVYLRKFEPWK